MPPHRRHGRYRYGPWQGGPDPLAPPYDVRQALDALGDSVLAGESLRDSLRELLRQGLPDTDGRRQGLQELLSRAMRMRREATRRGRLDGAVTRAAAQLDQALAAEREALAESDSDDARFAEAQLDNLPRSTAAAIQELSEYRWTSKEAEQIYRQILDSLRTDVLDQQFRGLRNALAGMRSAAAKAGHSIRAQSGYRSISDQRSIFLRHLREQGSFSNDQIASGQADRAIDHVLQLHSIPGYSRHHSGYAMDLSSGSDRVRAGTATEVWLRGDRFAHAMAYGFLPSYPPGGGNQGPVPEAWEYTYVSTHTIRCAGWYLDLADPAARWSCPAGP